MAKIFSSEEFTNEVLKSDCAFVDFYADWCGPCQAMGPVIDALAKEYEGRALVGKINVDASPEAARAYKVMSIPTMIIFKKGEAVKRIVGLTDEMTLKKEIDEALK